jgi:hypothetical protein
MTQAKRIYDPRIFEGRVMLPEEQEQIYELLLKSERLDGVSDSMRELVEDEWPELARKLAPNKQNDAMDANSSGRPWSYMDLRMLQDSLDYGDAFAQAASFLCRAEDEVRQKARALGLIEHPGKSMYPLFKRIAAPRFGYR